MTKRRDILRKVLVICLLALPAVTMIAQDFYDEFRAKSIDVDGMKIGQVLDYSQFVAKFGLPDKYEKQSSNGGDYEVTETYKKGKCYFEFCNGGYFCGFTLSDNSFSALTFLIKGGIKVGDKLSKSDDFTYGKPIVAEWLKPFSYYIPYVLFPEQDGKVFLFVRKGIIEKISYSDPT